jgi:uncharacterized protein with FMN-binding domain
MLKYVIGALVLIVGVGIFWLVSGMDEIKAMSISDGDLASVRDGTHQGTFSKGRWNYNVSVTVKDHKITAVNLLDDKMKMADKVNAEQINRVITKQSAKVDIVTGATVNSKALLKAIENALKSGASR